MEDGVKLVKGAKDIYADKNTLPSVYDWYRWRLVSCMFFMNNNAMNSLRVR